MSERARVPGRGPRPLASGLYVVATPIGNLGDMTLRALDVLSRVDVIACEDGRVAGKLFERHALGKGRFTRYHDHTDAQVREELLTQIALGKTVACICDAGTPLIADPGFKLVREARERGLMVSPVPGASASLAALCAAGLSPLPAHIVGFLPPKGSARLRLLRSYADPGTYIFFERPSRLRGLLGDFADVWGLDCKACVAREVTKMHEEFISGSLGELTETLARRGPLPGEAVVLVHWTGRNETSAGAETWKGLVERLMRDRDLSPREVVDALLSARAVSRRCIYAEAIRIKEHRVE